MGGVCAGLADHLSQQVWHVRLAFIGATFVGGAGIAAYLFLWALTPQTLAVPELRAAASAAGGATVPVLGGRRVSRESLRQLAVGAALVVLGAGLFAQHSGLNLRLGVLVPLLAVAVGAVLAWSQLDDAERDRWLARGGASRREGVVRLGLGVALATVGVVGPRHAGPRAGGPVGRGRRSGRGPRGGGAHRGAVGPPALAHLPRRAGRTCPRDRARRHRRAPARLGPADPRPDPAQGRRPRRGGPPRPRPGARAARLAVRRARAAPRRASPPPSPRWRTRSRTSTASPSSSSSPATGRWTSAAPRWSRRCARRCSTPCATRAAGLGLRRGRAGGGRGVRPRPRGRLRPRRGARRPARRPRVDHRPDGAPRRHRPGAPAGRRHRGRADACR